MSLITYNGTDFDSMLGSATITTTGVNVTTGGVTSSGVTAPNLINQITGCWIQVAILPTVANSGNYTVEIMEAGVSKALATINYADIKFGANYVRFATPYTFATLTASAYTARVTNTVSNTGAGQLRTAASGLWFQFTYDSTVATPTTSHDVWVGGFNDAGLTAKTCTISGTSNAWGTGVLNAYNSGIQATMGAALMIGSGGTLKFDQSASTTLTLSGSILTTVGGIFDMRPPSTKSIVSTLILNSAVANGDQGFFTANTVYGGQYLTNGATYDIYSKYASGLGTAASPMITSIAWDADVGDEIVVGGGTDYTKNEIRYIITRNSSTSFVLSSTPGGAETALANTHAVGAHMNNLTRNSIIKPANITRGYYAVVSSPYASNFDYTRMEYSDNTSGRSLNLDYDISNPTTFNGIVLYHNTTSGRAALVIQGVSTVTKSYSGITLYNTQGSNFAGQSGIYLQSSSNKTFTDCFHYNAPASTVSCAFISFLGGTSGASTSNTFNNCHSYGSNSVNSTGGYSIGIFTANNNVFNNCTINATRQKAVYLSAAVGNIFNNCNFGTMATNTVDIIAATGSLNQNYWNACYFGSATLHSNYLLQLDTSIAKFQDMDGSTSKHRWYTNYGSWWSAGSGLTDTTVRTAGSLSLVSKPENATTGSAWIFKIPANPASQVGVFGYVYRNATFSSGTLKVELFLPGTLLTATPDATYTFPTTTTEWLPFNISAYYSGSVARYAQVRITGVTATAGAYFFVDDLYDAGTGNKVAGLDLWDEGQPSQIMVQSDFSVVPSAVWGYSDSNTQANTMGQRQVDVATAVWDEVAGSHTTPGTTGAKLKDASKAKQLL